MGKTGAGKSTLINSVIGEDLVPTGVGGQVTQKNKIYTKTKMLKDSLQSTERLWAINLYDTVGLEIDSSITQRTLQEIRGYIERTQRCSDEDDVNLVWFCVNRLSSRFESYEIDLIRSMVSEHEIPFVVVVTQCFSSEQGVLEQQIKEEFPEFPMVNVLAKDYQTRIGTCHAFGVQELVRKSISSYNQLKINVLDSKLNNLHFLRENRLNNLTERAKECIEKHTSSAMKIGFVPILSIPVIHGMCIKTLSDINKIMGIKTAKGFEENIFANIDVGIIVTPFMAVPVVSGLVAAAYVASAGEVYLDAILEVIEKSTDDELNNIKLVSQRIKEELLKKKNR